MRLIVPTLSRRRLLTTAAALTLIGGTALPATSAFAADVAIYKLVTIDLVDEAIDGFMSALEGDYADVEFEIFDAQGQANLYPTIARQIIRDEFDLVAVIGTPVVLATVDAAIQAGSEVPIVFIAMGDPVGAGIADSLEVPGQQTTGTTDWVPPSETVASVLEVLPDISTIGTIWDPSNQNAIVFHDALEAAVADHEFDFVDVTIASAGEVFVAAQSLSGRVDAIILGPDAAVIQGLPAIGGIALEDEIPLFITSGDAATPGVLMTFGVDYGELGEIAGHQAAEVLSGTPIGTIPIVGPSGVTAVGNAETAAELGIEIPEEMMGAPAE